jgi:site-specific recombinase XerD
MHQYLSSFRNWLQTKNYSESTVRNYIVDLNKYFDFVISSSANPAKDIFAKESIAAYLTVINSDSNKDRYASSLSKFFSFCEDQKLIAKNPLAKKAPAKDDQKEFEALIGLYEKQLKQKNFSDATIRNYINDIRQFINWANNPDGVK